MHLAFLKRATIRIRLLRSDKRGQDMIEYALLAAAIVVLVFGALPSAYSESLSLIWSRVTEQMNRVP